DGVGEPERRRRRRRIGPAVDVREPAGRLRDGPESGEGPVRSRLAEARHPGEDETGVLGAEHLVTQVPFLEPAGSERFDDDVDLRRELAHQLPTLLRAQVDTE